MALVAGGILVVATAAVPTTATALPSSDGTVTYDQTFVDATFQDVLARQPSSSEVIWYMAAYGPYATSTARGKLVSALAATSEGKKVVIDRLYETILGRPADTAGETYWLAALNGGMSAAKITAYFYASTEYYERMGGSDATSWVESLYRNILQREPDTEGRTYWVGQEATSGRYSVAYAMYQLSESSRVRVEHLYERLLGRQPDANGWDYWSGIVSGSGDFAVARGLMETNEYYERAWNLYGPPSVTAPGAPGSVMGVAGDGQVAVSWVAPSTDGGATVSGYQVTASPGGGTCATTGALSCVVTGLTNGTGYTFTVTASNSAGTSPPSVASPSVTPRASVAAPGAPGSVMGVAGDGQVAVSWVAPSTDGGATVSGYQVTASPGGGTCATTGALSCVVTGLTNGTGYTFTVTASNSAGTSPPSVASPSVVPGVPSPPRNVVGTPSNGAVTVTWSAPASLADQDVLQYVVASTVGSFGCTANSGGSCTVTGLTNGTSYSFTVTARNGSGVSAPSAPSPAVTPFAEIAPPGDLAAVAGDEEATVTWSPPGADGGTGFTGYTVQSSPAGGTCSTTGSLSCTVTGLQNGTTYIFTAVTTSSTGASSPSGSSNSVTPAPNPATSFTAVWSGAHVVLNWVDPDPATNKGEMLRRSVGSVAPTSPTAGSLIANLTSTVDTFTDSTVAPDQTYSYSLFAYDDYGRFSPSASVTVKTQACSAGIGNVGGTLAGNTVWGSACVTTYVVGTTGPVVVPSGVSLTIGPGVVVKGSSGVLIQVLPGGSLSVQGTAGAPASFTSLNDQSLGADTSTAATRGLAPATGDYSTAIQVWGGSVSLTHASVEYADSGLYDNSFITDQDMACTATAPDPDARVTIDQSSFQNNRIGINLGINRVCVGHLSVTRSAFLNNTEMGIDSGVPDLTLNSSDFIDNPKGTYLENMRDMTRVDFAGPAPLHFSGGAASRQVDFSSPTATVPRNTAWTMSSDNGAAFCATVSSFGSLNIQPGTILKCGVIKASYPGVVTVAGSDLTPVQLSSYDDDDLGGTFVNSNHIPGGRDSASAVLDGADGAMTIDHAQVRYGATVRAGDSIDPSLLGSPGASIAISNSVFDQASSVYFTPWVSASIASSTFENGGAPIDSSAQHLVLNTTQFLNNQDPVFIENDEDLTGIALEGSSAISMSPAGYGSSIAIADSVVPYGKSFTMGSESGATLSMWMNTYYCGGDCTYSGDFPSIKVAGHLTVDPGTKMSISPVSNGIEVFTGATIDMNGSSGAPIVVTSGLDQHAGFDAGPPCTQQCEDPTLEYNRPGYAVWLRDTLAADSIKGTVFRYMTRAIKVDTLSSLSVQGSEFAYNDAAFSVRSLDEGLFGAWGSNCRPPYLADIDATGSWFGNDGLPGADFSWSDFLPELPDGTPAEIDAVYKSMEPMIGESTKASLNDNTVPWAKFSCTVDLEPPITIQFPVTPVLYMPIAPAAPFPSLAE